MPTIALPEESAVPTGTQTPVEIEITFATIEAEPDLPSAYPAVQPLRAALYFDSPNGFGPWRLVMPQRAEKDLRDARKRDPKLFDIIIKKLRCTYIPLVVVDCLMRRHQRALTWSFLCGQPEASRRI